MMPEGELWRSQESVSCPYSPERVEVERRSMKTLLAMVAGSVSVVLVALFVYIAVKSVCHECLTFPMAAVCERRGGAVDVEMESNRIGGYIKERQFAGCVFYWHEANSGGD
jgi:hypothetical protein